MTKAREQLLMGTLDLLILHTLESSREPLHGWMISRRIRDRSEGVLDVRQGSLYPALHRLEAGGHIRGEWGTSELGRRAKHYRLTRGGTSRLKVELDRWRGFVESLGRVIAAAQGVE